MKKLQSKIEQLSRRALRLVSVPWLSLREERLLALAEEVGLDAGRSVFVDHARIYLALACCSWAVRTDLAITTRKAALAAAIVLGAAASENLREVMGLNEKLRGLAASSIDSTLARHALSVTLGELHGELDAFRAIDPVLRRLEFSAVECSVARGTG